MGLWYGGKSLRLSLTLKAGRVNFHYHPHLRGVIFIQAYQSRGSRFFSPYLLLLQPQLAVLFLVRVLVILALL